MIRTPKEWIESCDKCGGCGKLKKKERFNLATPEEQAHWKIDPVTTLPGTPKNSYVCMPIGGCTIFECIKEAVGIAKVVERPVAFVFNTENVVVYRDSDAEEVAKEWWVRAYGKTYEESMAER